jgi:putative restriction endonuclease
LHKGNPEVVRLAKLIDRTSNSVAFTLINFASLDPSLKARGIKRASNANKLDKEIWNEFINQWNKLPFEIEKLLAKLVKTTLEKLNHISEKELPKDGKIRERMVKVRVNQAFFRSSVLASYNNTCCITGIQQPELLIAGHIKPWSLDAKNRMNLKNGIAINALHDKAIESGYITITTDYRIRISPVLMKQKNSKSMDDNFLKYDCQEIRLPSRFLPDPEFLKYHNEVKFKQ